MPKPNPHTIPDRKLNTSTKVTPTSLDRFPETYPYSFWIRTYPYSSLPNSIFLLLNSHHQCIPFHPHLINFCKHSPTFSSANKLLFLLKKYLALRFSVVILMTIIIAFATTQITPQFLHLHNVAGLT